MDRIHFGRENPVSFAPQEREELERGVWRTNCRSIVVDNGDGRRYTGPGYLAQDEKKGVVWTLFDSRAEIHLGHALERFGTPGEWLPDSAYYSLEANDWQGRAWKAHHVQPQFEAGWTAEGGTVHGSTRALLCRGDWKPSRSYVHLTLPGRVRLPENASEDPDRPLPVEEYTSGPRRRVCELSSGGREFRGVIWPERTRIAYREAEGRPLPYDCPARLEEVVWVMTGQAVRWSIRESGCVRGGCELGIYAAGEALPARWFNPPVNPRDPTGWEDFESLFFAYFDHVSEAPEGRRHPTSVDAWRVYQAAKRAPEDLALALAVSVERMVRRYFAADLEVSYGTIAEFRELEHFIDSWTGPDTLKRRVQGAIAHWKGGSVRDALRSLVRRGVVAEQHRKVWERLRHTHAHGTHEGDGEIRHLLEDILLLHQAWLLLLGEAVGYEDRLTDWTQPGWLLRAASELVGEARRPEEAETDLRRD